MRTGSTYTSNLNLQLDVDLARLVSWPDTIVYLDGLWLQGGLPSTFVGDAQGVSNISAPSPAPFEARSADEIGLGLA